MSVTVRTTGPGVLELASAAIAKISSFTLTVLPIFTLRIIVDWRMDSSFTLCSLK